MQFKINNIYKIIILQAVDKNLYGKLFVIF
jgi:hypothetical protein